MTDLREERRLAAIVIGDVVGYSRLMGMDEVATMTALKAHRRELILPLLASYRARLVNSSGDAMLLEFGSAVDAVSCSAMLQRAMQARNGAIDPERQIRFRLGINLGDIVIDGNEIYGDGVNVAARLETMCEPGGLCLSRSIEEQVKDKLPYPFEDRGEHSLKNINRPVRVYAMSAAAIADLPEPVVAAEPRLAAATQLRVTPGTKLNDAYAIDRLIGSGGMGEIFEGHEIHTGDAVAIKLIRLDMEGNEAALGLFQKEASVLKHVYHEAVVRYYVFSFDQTVRRHYLAMEYVDGPSLSELMRRGPMAYEAVDALRKRVAAGLHVAHERGVIHRDVSPDNIILPDGDVTRAKIIDFGIARSANFGGGTIIGGGFAGKYNYVSPEQLGLYGGDVTARSDIYSFGLVLAGALTGEPIDMGGTQAETIEKRRAVPDLVALDDRLRGLIDLMLQPDPANRPESMGAVVQWTPGVAAPSLAPRSAIPAGPPRAAARADAPVAKRSLQTWIIGGALLAALVWGGSLAVLHFTAERPASVATSPTLDVPPGTQQPSSEPARPAEPTVTPPSKPDQPETTPSATTPTVEPIPPPIQPQPPSPDAPSAVQRVAAFLGIYDGGPCFFAKAGDVTDHSAGILGFAATPDAFDLFAKAFAKALGFEPDLIGNRLWSHQCPAASFLHQADETGGVTPDLFIKSTRLRGGQTLSGEISRAEDQAIMLLRVREDGAVENLTPTLKDKDGVKDFDVPLPQSNGGGPFPQLLVAIASDRPLRAPGSGQTADQVFPALLKNAAETKQKIGVSARLVLIGG